MDTVRVARGVRIIPRGDLTSCCGRRFTLGVRWRLWTTEVGVFEGLALHPEHRVRGFGKIGPGQKSGRRWDPNRQDRLMVQSHR